MRYIFVDWTVCLSRADALAGCERSGCPRNHLPESMIAADSSSKYEPCTPLSIGDVISTHLQAHAGGQPMLSPPCHSFVASGEHRGPDAPA